MGKIFIWIYALFCVCVGGYVIFEGYCLGRDINAMIDRAQVAADREDMANYVRELKVNMEKYGMIKGHTALIFKTPANDMALHYLAINRVLERLETIKDISKSDTAYQVALSDVRGVLRELHNPAYGWLWVSYWYLIIPVVIPIFCLLVWLHD